jgi:hypothetical protein
MLRSMKTTFVYVFAANISCRYLSLLAVEETISPLWAESQQEALGTICQKFCERLSL